MSVSFIIPLFMLFFMAPKGSVQALVLDTTWTRTYSTGAGRGVVLADSGYILSSRTVAKLDLNGKPLWTMEGLIDFGAKIGTGFTGFRGDTLIHLDHFGKEISRKVLKGRPATQTPNGWLLYEVLSKDTIKLSEVDSLGNSIRRSDIFLSCLSKNVPTDTQVTRSIRFQAVTPLSAGGYILLTEMQCSSNFSNISRYELIATKIDSTLIPIFGKSLTGLTIGGVSQTRIVELTAANWAIYGTKADFPPAANLYATVYDSSFRIIGGSGFTNTCRGCTSPDPGNIIQSADGNLVLIGKIGRSLWIHKMKLNGDSIWTRSFPGPPAKPEAIWTSGAWISETPDTGFIATGSYDTQTWLLKLKYYDSLRTAVISSKLNSEFNIGIALRSLTDGNTHFQIFSDHSDRVIIQVWDLSGKQLMSLKPKRLAAQKPGTIEGVFSTPAPGLYFITIAVGNASQSIKWLQSRFHR
jgi:hypothetical protein